jgi:hypothetical protein
LGFYLLNAGPIPKGFACFKGYQGKLMFISWSNRNIIDVKENIGLDDRIKELIVKENDGLRFHQQFSLLIINLVNQQFKPD